MHQHDHGWVNNFQSRSQTQRALFLVSDQLNEKMGYVRREMQYFVHWHAHPALNPQFSGVQTQGIVVEQGMRQAPSLVPRTEDNGLIDERGAHVEPSPADEWHGGSTTGLVSVVIVVASLGRLSSGKSGSCASIRKQVDVYPARCSEDVMQEFVWEVRHVRHPGLQW